MINLRPYQLEAVQKIYDDFFELKNVLCVAATGAGKTEIMMAFIGRVFDRKPDFKACILLNKVDLLDQTYRRFSTFFGSKIKISQFCGSNGIKDLSGQIVIATIQSINDIAFDKVHLTVIDEAHNMNFKEGGYKDFLDRNPCKVLGFTATPFNQRGYIFGQGKFFEKISYKITLPDLIDLGFLVKPLIKEPSEKFDTSNLNIKMGDFDAKQLAALVDDDVKISTQVTDALKRLSDRNKCVWACTSIKHAEIVYSYINEPKAIIHSQLTRDEREKNFKSFTNGSARHLVFITIVSEGFDYPPIDAVVLMRPTRSPVLYVQTIGRALRINENKKDALILDYGEVIRNCGPINNPWIKIGRSSKKQREKEKSQFKTCPECQEIVDKSLIACPACEYSFLKIKNLNLKPATEAEIIAKPKLILIDSPSVRFDKHKSKAGNDCLKITYSDPKNILARQVCEYFQLGNDWAEKKLNSRLLSFFKVPPNFDHILNGAIKTPQVLPKSITYEMEDQYPRIKEIKF